MLTSTFWSNKMTEFDFPSLTGKEQPVVLVVDDNAANCRILANYLSGEPYEIHTASGGHEALEQVYEHDPDILLLDIMMPDISGFEVSAHLKNEEKHKDVPIIFFSAQGETDSKLRAFQLGAVDYITKPIKKEELIARLKTHLTVRFQQMELQRKNEELNRVTEALRKREQQLEELNQALQHAAYHDGLTNLINRRYFFELAGEKWSESRNSGSGLSALMIDIDHFKSYNDAYGHIAGDTCLIKVAKLLSELFNHPNPILARYGGEEFVVLLSHMDREEVEEQAKKVCRKLEQQNIPNKLNGKTTTLTLSIGVAHDRGFNASSLECLLQQADEALYEAKRQGRNRTVTYQG